MSAADVIANWVERKPMILVRFGEAFSESLFNSRQGFDHLTIVKPHWVFKEIKHPTLCLLEVKLSQSYLPHNQEEEETECYLGTVTRKAPVSTFDSRLTIKKLRPVNPSSIEAIGGKITETRMRNLYDNRIPGEGDFSNLSAKLSAHIVKVLAGDPENHNALDTALTLLPSLRRTPHANLAQEDAIKSAIAAFGIQGNAIPDQIVLKRGSSSGLGLVGAHLYEDNIVHADASHLPGFDSIAPDVTGRAVFMKRDERLVIYTANKLPLEKMLGVDLIYINETRGNIVMVQYKMLKEDKHEPGNHDWLFRPNKQLRDEIARMRFPDFKGAIVDYRLNSNPFFFKFVKRKIVDDSHQSFLVSLDHLNQILADPKAKGPKRGIRLSFNALDGTYLREADMISLIRSGYIGTHRAETKALAAIIEEVAKGNRALVLAWQHTVKRA